MLPSSSSQGFFFDGSAGSSNAFDPVNIGVVQGQPGINVDPNSPEMFNTNVKTALQYVEIISKLTNNAIVGIEQAFHSGAQLSSESASTDMTSISQYLDGFTHYLVQTGVGALPLISEESTAILKDEPTLFAEASVSVKEMYARKQQLEENNGTVANLLAAPESSNKK